MVPYLRVERRGHAGLQLSQNGWERLALPVPHEIGDILYEKYVGF
jgi:hypothetical protein